MAEPLDDPEDAVLIAAVRAGDAGAYGKLYQRYLLVAKRAARSLTSSVVEREDLVAEAFAQVLRAIRNGRGPTLEFRPYLLVTIRNAAISASRRSLPVAGYEVPERLLTDTIVEDPMSTRIHAGVVVDAFARLPERWRIVLWHTEIEGLPPAVLAPRLGLTANGVSALACRAREGLRQSYLELHLPDRRPGACRITRAELAAWVRRGMPRRITGHLERCSGCRAEVADLVRINDELDVGVPCSAPA